MNKRIAVTRIRPPEIHKNLVSRPHLEEQLMNGAAKKLLVVEAGAGKGKTTIVRAFLATVPSEQVKWFRAAEDCNHQLVFWGYMLEVLQDELGEAKEELADTFSAGISEESLDVFLAFLVNCLLGVPKLFLVVDDFQTITDKGVLVSLEQLLRLLPTTIHIILITRHEVPLYLSQLAMSGEMLHLSEADFQLSQQEAHQFLRQSSANMMLTELQKQQLVDTANGWIGGLQLLLAANLPILTADFALVKQEDRIVSDYLSKEIFQQLSKEEQQFLTFTAYFSFVNKELVQQLLTDCDYQQMMQQLINKNLLIICTDYDHQVYQYHPLFKEFLTQRFFELPSELQLELKTKAAAAYLQQQELDEGIALLMELKEYQQVMQLILAEQQTLRLHYYIEQIPQAAAVKNIDFSYQKIFYHYSVLDYQTCFDMLEALEAAYPEVNEIKAIDGLRILLGTVPSTYEEKAVSLAEIDQLRLNDTSKAFIVLKNAVLFYYQDQFWEAIEFIHASLALSAPFHNSFLSYFGHTLLVQVFEEIGELNKGLQLLKTSETVIDELHFSPAMKKNYLVTFHMTVTGIHLKQLQLDNAAETLAYVKEEQQSGPDFAYYYNYAEYLYLKDQPEEAFEILQQLETHPLDEYTSSFVLSGILKYSLKQQQLSKSYLDHYVTYFLTNDQVQTLGNQLFYSMVLLAQGNETAALEATNQVLTTSREKKIYLKIIEAALLKIKILLQQSIPAERTIIALYNESLYYASSNSIQAIYYFFKEEVAYLHEHFGETLIQDAGAQERTFHQRIIDLCIDKKENILTEREYEVLIEIANGRPNKEIAEVLYISGATVKTHIANLYRKLEVNSRVAAVEKARQLTILE